MADQTIFAVGAPTQYDGVGFTVALPAGTLTGKTLVIVCVNDAADSLTAVGFSQLANVTGGAGIGRLTAVWKHFDGTESNPVDCDASSGNGGYAFMFAVQDGLEVGDVVGAVGTGAAALANAAVSANGITPGDKHAVFMIVGALRAVASPTCSAYSGTDPTFTEFFDNGASSVALAAFVSLHCAMGIQDTGAPTGARTATLSAAPIEWQSVMFSLKPAAVVSDSVGASGDAGKDRGYRMPQVG